MEVGEEEGTKEEKELTEGEKIWNKWMNPKYECEWSGSEELLLRSM